MVPVLRHYSTCACALEVVVAYALAVWISAQGRMISKLVTSTAVEPFLMAQDSSLLSVERYNSSQNGRHSAWLKSFLLLVKQASKPIAEARPCHDL